MPIWGMAPLCLMWYVWRERNTRCFEDCEIDMMNLKRMMLQTMFMWEKNFSLCMSVLFLNLLIGALFFLWIMSFLYTLCVLWVAPFCAFWIYFTYKKNKMVMPKSTHIGLCKSSSKSIIDNKLTRTSLHWIIYPKSKIEFW
jgi:hypothetical protein